MDAKEEILGAALALTAENGGDLSRVTLRAVSERANTSLGLISYHFGSKSSLMAACAERIINGVIDQFCEMRDSMQNVPPHEKLRRLGELTFSYLFQQEAVSRMSILQDIQRPNENSNTVRTFEAFLPLVAACRPDMGDSAARAATWSLIVQMQQAFLQSEHLRLTTGVNLADAKARSDFHAAIVEAVLGNRSNGK